MLALIVSGMGLFCCGRFSMLGLEVYTTTTMHVYVWGGWMAGSMLCFTVC